VTLNSAVNRVVVLVWLCALLKTKYKIYKHSYRVKLARVFGGVDLLFPPFLSFGAISLSHHFYTEVIVNQFLCAYRKTASAVAHTTITVPPPCAQPIIHGENIKTLRRRQLVQALFPHSPSYVEPTHAHTHDVYLFFIYNIIPHVAFPVDNALNKFPASNFPDSTDGHPIKTSCRSAAHVRPSVIRVFLYILFFIYLWATLYKSYCYMLASSPPSK